MSYRSANLNKYTTTNPIYRWHINAFHDHLTELTKSCDPVPSSILDAGCGEGHLSNALRACFPGARIVGIDNSEEAIAYARAEFPDAATFDTGDVFRLPCADGEFDLVVCSQVLEHLSQPGDAAEELKRVASANVLISVPLEPYFKFFNDISRALGVSPDPEHVQFWTKKSFPLFIRDHFSQASFSTLHYYQAALATV